MFDFLVCFTHRRQVTPRLSLTSIVALNYLLRLEIFVSEDRQLWAVHLILDFDPIPKIFQEVGHAIQVGDPRINRINVSKPNFLAPHDLPPVILPGHQIPPQLVVPLQQVLLGATVAIEEGVASSRLSLDEEIDQFHFREETRVQENPVELLDSETKSDKLSSTCPIRSVVTPIDSSPEGGERMEQ